MKVALVGCFAAVVLLSCVASFDVAHDLRVLQRDISELRAHREATEPLQALLSLKSEKGVTEVAAREGFLIHKVTPGSGPDVTVVLLVKDGLENFVFHPSMSTWKPSYKSIPNDDPDYQNKMLDLAKGWLATWKSGNPGNLLKVIFIADSVSLNGNNFGGFFSPAGNGDVIWMAKSTINRDEWYSSLYHEHAHLVHAKMCNSEDPSNAWNKKWRSVIPAGFTWKGQCGADCSRDVKESLYSQGFLTGYNTVSLSEDVAQFANALWMGTLQVWECAEKNGACRVKIDLIVELYKMVDPKFDKDFFISRKTIKRLFVMNEFNRPHPPASFNMKAFDIGDFAYS